MLHDNKSVYKARSQRLLSNKRIPCFCPDYILGSIMHVIALVSMHIITITENAEADYFFSIFFYDKLHEAFGVIIVQLCY